MSNQEAVKNFIFWCLMSAALCVGIFFFMGGTSAAEFAGAWAMEKTLSIDNLFMFLLVFKLFRTPPEAQPTILKYGIIGVIVLRAIFIGLGTGVIALFQPLLYVFALSLFYGAYKLAKDEAAPTEAELRQNWLVRIFDKYLAFVPSYHGNKFFVYTNRDESRFSDTQYAGWSKKGTMALMTLIIIEGTDLMFAFDSVPAALAVSQNFFIVFSSNLLAVMGLRAIYFLLQNMEARFQYMKVGVALLLVFAGVKILLPLAGLHLSIGWSLGIIVSVITASIGYSLHRSRPIPMGC